MKKFFLLVPVAALAMTACTSESNEFVGDSQEQAREIKFSPLAQKATRAPSATTPAVVDDTYPDELTMQVAAYAMPISSTTWTAGGYFDKTPFNGTNTLNWKGTPARYWPLSDAHVTFLAVAGVEADDVTSMGDPYASGATVKYDAASFAAQTDLMYSGKQKSVTKSGNALVFPPAVNMSFIHALAWLQFNVRAADGAYDEKFAITKIVINDANETGTFTITNTGYDTAGDPTPTGTWGNSPQDWTVADYEVPSSTIAEGSLTTAYQACGKALLVPRTSTFSKFTIYYTLDGKAFTFDYTPETRDLAQATKYVYNITFKLTEIEIDPVVAAWTDGGSEYIDIPATALAYSAGASAGSYDVENTAGTYTIYVTGLGSSDVVSATETGGNDYIDGDITATNTSGTVKLVFKMKANDSVARSTTITLSNTTASTTTTITINQAAH